MERTTSWAGVEEYRKIQIGNGVWIGSNAVILPGVTIGDGVVIAAGSVVNRDCDANSFYAGTPAKYVRTLPMGDQTDSPQ